MARDLDKKVGEILNRRYDLPPSSYNLEVSNPPHSTYDDYEVTAYGEAVVSAPNKHFIANAPRDIEFLAGLIEMLWEDTKYIQKDVALIVQDYAGEVVRQKAKAVVDDTTIRRLRSSIYRVRNLHRPMTTSAGEVICKECSFSTTPGEFSPVKHPCETSLAIDDIWEDD